MQSRRLHIRQGAERSCPAGKVLTTTGKLFNDAETLYYRARTRDCRSCLLKSQCCPKAPLRRIQRSIYEEARDVARALAKTEAFERSRRDRKRVEMLFAHLKRIFRLGRLRLRGPRGAQFEFTHQRLEGDDFLGFGLQILWRGRAGRRAALSFLRDVISNL
ncbi:MAG: transposase [Xanthobacteraceae bacterium]